MPTWRRGFSPAIASVLLVTCATALAQTPQFTQADAAAIDAVFADYDTPGSPGCMLGVVRDGGLLYSRGYGRASLEHDVPFTTRTIFDIGSTSKQVVAAAIVLLAQDGKLALDDDIRRHLPEMPDYGTPITIRHLLTHTSGLRDYITLMTLAGWQMEDVTTPGQALDIIRRQRALDFAPGTEFAYSNTGFFLASIVVERVSGTPLGDFARERLFGPLGMTATRYMSEHDAVVPHRAMGYEPHDSGYRVAMSNWEQLGDGAVQTSIDDLLKWDANFYTGALGGRALIDALTSRNRLKTGAPTPYGLGLFVEEYRGLQAVRHGGSWAGYRAELVRFPAERTSVMVLCNLGTADPEERANRVADVLLRDRLPKPAAPPPGKVPPADTRALAGFAGVYWNDERMQALRFRETEHGLGLVSGSDLLPLVDTGDGTYGPPQPGARFRFLPGEPKRIERLPRSGVPVTLTGLPAWTPDPATLDRYTGTFFSEELQARWTLVRDGDALVIRDLRASPQRWVPAVPDVFTNGSYALKFVVRDGRPAEILVGAGRARGMRFVRVDAP